MERNVRRTLMTLLLPAFVISSLIFWNIALSVDHSGNLRTTRMHTQQKTRGPDVISPDAVISRKLASAQSRDNGSLTLNHSNGDSVTVITTETIQNVTSPETEVRHIGFLKVHKAASSTMQNIFFRFGLKRGLSFVLTNHPNYFSRSSKENIPLVIPKYRKGYDILCNHAVFNYGIYRRILPRDTVYLAIVRDPLDVFISAVNYYSEEAHKLEYINQITGNKLQKLIQNPEEFETEFFSYTKNVMARDFGFPTTSNYNRIQIHLKKLDQIFKLVLIVEHFEESLILMKRYLKWKLPDILFISNNVLGKQGSNLSISNLTNNDLAKFKNRNKLDYYVYNFFYEKFWRQFRSEPETIHSEVLNYKEVLKSTQTFCQTRQSKDDLNFLVVPESPWNEKFSVSREDCEYMTKNELDFIQILRHEQGSEISEENKAIRTSFVGNGLIGSYKRPASRTKHSQVKADKRYFSNYKNIQ